EPGAHVPNPPAAQSNGGGDVDDDLGARGADGIGEVIDAGCRLETDAIEVLSARGNLRAQIEKPRYHTAEGPAHLIHRPTQAVVPPVQRSNREARWRARRRSRRETPYPRIARAP